jgi:hypothetical protein
MEPISENTDKKRKSTSSLDNAKKKQKKELLPEREWVNIIMSNQANAAMIMNYVLHEGSVVDAPCEDDCMIEGCSPIPVIINERYSQNAKVSTHEKKRWTQSLPFETWVRVELGGNVFLMFRSFGSHSGDGGGSGGVKSSGSESADVLSTGILAKQIMSLSLSKSDASKQHYLCIKSASGWKAFNKLFDHAKIYRHTAVVDGIRQSVEKLTDERGILKLSNYLPFLSASSVFLPDSMVNAMVEFVKSSEKNTSWKAYGTNQSCIMSVQGPQGTGRFSMVRALATSLKRRIHTVVLDGDVSDDELMCSAEMNEPENTILVIKKAQFLIRSINSESLIDIHSIFRGYLASQSVCAVFIFDSDQSDGFDTTLKTFFDAQWITKAMAQNEVDAMCDWADAEAKMVSRKIKTKFQSTKLPNGLKSSVLSKWLKSMHSHTEVNDDDWKRLKDLNQASQSTNRHSMFQ